MSSGILNLMMMGIMGIIAFMIIRSVATTICSNVTGWSTTEQVLICQIIGIVVATTVILMLFLVMKTASGGGNESEDGADGNEGTAIKIIKNPKSLVLIIEKASTNLGKYMNNLDSLLGVKTIIDKKPRSEYGLSLNEVNELYIHPDYEWYLVDKHSTMDMFKVVGLHKENKDKNVAFVLGKKQDGKPYLIKISTNYGDASAYVKLNDWEEKLVKI
jgi:membrane protein implicated in regulation of membrane protease activity